MASAARFAFAALTIFLYMAFAIPEIARASVNVMPVWEAVLWISYVCVDYWWIMIPGFIAALIIVEMTVDNQASKYAVYRIAILVAMAVAVFNTWWFCKLWGMLDWMDLTPGNYRWFP